MHGKHVHLREYAHKYERFKVTATAGSVAYGSTTSEEKKPKVAYTQVVKNGQPSQSQKITVSKTVVHLKTATWTTETAFRSSFSLKASATLKEVVALESKLEIGLDYRSGRDDMCSQYKGVALQALTTSM
ncbi:hypothetical protein HPB47_017263 [Ixodes persulcatus]|uniref:Uncharacterized protein n=1 Tax=Ixodes persulcatus TaxID=34615 RepID=A0AC60QNR2_IXOPE|nr:hypothetical protein HPB47_017263 [Ixodes persulcatus]